jgi:hypothetical protein
MDPLPFYQKNGGQSKQYEVWVEDEETGTMVLNNDPSNGTLVIQRYWKETWGKLTPETWAGKLLERRTAFTELKKEFEIPMAAIKASLYYDTSYPTEEDKPVFPLRDLHAAMGDFVRVPTTAAVFSDRGPWGSDDWDGRGGTLLRPTETGPLYELYFGHIPEKNEYVDQSTTAVYVYTVAGVVGGGKEKTGSGAPGGSGIMLKDAYGYIVDNDTPLTVMTRNSNGSLNTGGKTVVPTGYNAPAGYTYLKWTIESGNDVVSLGVVEPEKPYLYPTGAIPNIVPKKTGTATVTVQNCTITGASGPSTASFKVDVKEGSDPFGIQFTTKPNDANLYTNISATTLSKGVEGKAILSAEIEGDYQWTLAVGDSEATDIAEEDGGTEKDYTFDSTSKDTGTYHIGLKMTKAGVSYSKTIAITVVN